MDIQHSPENFYGWNVSEISIFFLEDITFGRGRAERENLNHASRMYNVFEFTMIFTIILHRYVRSFFI